MSRNTKLTIGAVILVLLLFVWAGLGLTAFFISADAMTHLRVGMTRQQVRSHLHLYRESSVHWTAAPAVRTWFFEGYPRSKYKDSDLNRLDVRSYALLGGYLSKPIFVAYDRTGHVVAVQEYD